MKKVLSALLVLALGGALLAGCGGASATSSTATSSATAASSATAPASSEAASEAPGEAITFTDMTGREITLDGPAQKVVALTAADCEILYALGAGDTLVGRGEYCDYPAAVLEVPVVQSGAETNIEEIIALAPDVVLMNTMAQTTEQIQSLEDAGAHVVVSEATDIAGAYTAIDMIGKVTGKTDEATALIDEMKAGFAQIEEGAEGSEGKTIYFETSPLEYGLWSAGSGTFMDEIATMLGLTNIFGDVEGWPEVSEEQVIQRNPDYIITIAMSFGDGPDPVEEIMGRDGWQNITAIQDGNVFAADSDQLTRPGPRLVEGVQSLYDFIYGGQAAGDASAAGSSLADSSAAA